MKLILSILLLIIITFVLATLTVQSCQGAEVEESQAIRAIIGEASDQGFQGMLAIACGIRNRGTLKGVYGLNAKHVDNEPQWVWRLAKKAWKKSEHNRIHPGTNWENIKAFGEPYWVKSMVKVYKHKDHIFYVIRGKQ